MEKLNSVEFLKFHRIPTWMKATPFILALAIATPLFSETLSTGADTTDALSSPVPSKSVTTSSSIASQQAEDGQSEVALPKIVAGDTIAQEDMNDAAATEVTEALVPSLAWESLQGLEQSDRENAHIALETASKSATLTVETVQNAQSLWNSGSFDQAIDAIRSIEESGNSIGLGINWKTPKTVISANWENSDSKIGSRTDIAETHLDFDAQNGNLFTVLKRNSGTDWGWAVNISSDGGTTWQETYMWFGSALITDVSAAVVGNYLWVGYVAGENNTEARMRRMNVSDGSVDSAYFYKVIFDKGRPIKEIVVFTNADVYDNRVYYTAILDDYTTVLNSVVAQTSAAKKTVVAAAGKAEQQTPIKIGTSKQMLPQLATSEKLRHPNETLKNFNNGQTKTRVIINLVNPDGVSKTTNAVSADFGDIDARDAITQEITSVQNNVLNKMDKTQVRVTNTFKYIFGFSAEVTVEGLASLVNDPNVLSIEPDVIIEPHLQQAIPQMNAMTSRTNYNGTGMSIAICDTGIDYGHAMLGGGGFPNSKVLGGYDTGEDDNDPMDEQGHGTSVAGIAAGTLGTNGDYIGGVAYNAKLYALKMSRADIGHSAYTADMVEAWEWAVTHQNDDPSNPIRIINTSFGGGYYTDEATCDAASVAMATAAANAKAAGITIFVSTGNDGLCDGTGWPGCMSDVIGVGAVYDADIGTPGWCVSSNSCIGTPHSGCSTGYAAFETSTALDQVTLYSNSASFMEVFAPSNNAYTTALGGGYTTSFGGTSAASPYAAGAGAILQSAHHAKTGSYLTPDQLQAALIDTGDSITDGKVAITKPRVNVGNVVSAIDNLTFHWGFDVDTINPIWIEEETGIGNVLRGLDATTTNSSMTSDWFFHYSYIANNGMSQPVMALRHDVAGNREATEVLADYTGNFGGTSISAYGDTAIVAYEHLFTNIGIMYHISYNNGDTWNFGSFESAVGEFRNPDVTARGGQGTAIVYDHEDGAFDPVWYQFRSGYMPGGWDTAVQINEHDAATAFPNTIQWLPSSLGNNYGVIYLDNSLDAYFDKALSEKKTNFLPAVYYLLN